MKWNGAWLAAVVFAGGCTVAGPRPDAPAPRPDRPAAPGVPGVPVAPGAEPGVRVGVLVGVETARIQAAAPFELVDDAGRVRARGATGETWNARRSGDGVEAVGPRETVRVAGSLVLRPTVAANEAALRVDGKAYRGTVILRPAAQGVTVVNVIDLENYLLGVVPHEIGPNRPPEEYEAVKAQAIAARTYTIRHMGRRSDLGFDVYATVQDQVYGGADSEDPVSTQAVLATRGEIIVYQGEPIEAYYHSTCGGHTAALEEVWVGEPRPYLRAVSDARPSGGHYCEHSNRFHWTEQWDRAALVSAIDRGLRDRGELAVPVTRVEFMAITGRTPSGRAEALRIRTNAGDHRIQADSIRWVLRPEPNRGLNSALIELQPQGNGEITSLRVDGQGWGHGIGMCQVGAMGRARDGHSYRDILSAYYPGTSIARLYP
jgi:stage II sporulation protein D